MPLVVVGESRKVFGQSPQSLLKFRRRSWGKWFLAFPRALHPVDKFLIIRTHGKVDVPQKLARTLLLYPV